MCNQYSFKTSLDRLTKDFAQLGLDLGWEGGAPNLEPREIIRPTDVAPVIAADGEGVMLRQLSWGFPRPKGGPVINFRSDGRKFPQGRCLIPADGFYEFTGVKTPKTRWLFTATRGGLLGIAGLIRDDRFTMLTTKPGPDIAPYHDRQVVLLEPGNWAAWLGQGGENVPLGPAPAGTLTVEQIGGAQQAPTLPFRS
jgi:putative SOS response-associated peptidase YedK